jgi:aldehyde dehydrogenase (NAD+)
MRDLAFGGGCVNDCIMQLTNLRMPFGGVGESGMGAYHGRAGFDCFTRAKSVLTASARVDLPIRYAPRKGKLGLFRQAMK